MQEKQNSFYKGHRVPLAQDSQTRFQLKNMWCDVYAGKRFLCAAWPFHPIVSSRFKDFERDGLFLRASKRITENDVIRRTSPRRASRKMDAWNVFTSFAALWTKWKLTKKKKFWTNKGRGYWPYFFFVYWWRFVSWLPMELTALVFWNDT
jgi:hypothetical protein